MCGIAGVYDLKSRRTFSFPVLQRMLKALFHRGPDYSGFLQLAGYSTGVQRLALRDPKNANQPVTDSDFVFSYNGELFSFQEDRNYLQNKSISFLNHSDTEVFCKGLQSDRIKFLQKVDAQFAFAFYDLHEHSLLLARDRFGISPLYYTIVDNLLIYSSEIKSILASGLVSVKLNPEAIDHVLTNLAIHQGETSFSGIYAIPPGNFLIAKEESYTIQKYIHSEYDKDFYSSIPFQETEKTMRILELEEKLFSSVERRLEADAKLGVYLSGGVDSSLIAAIASKVWKKNYPLTAYSIQLQNNSNQKDESHFALDTANFLGIRHVALKIRSEDIIKNYAKAVYHAEMPILDHANICLMLLARRVREDGLKAVLTGEGADEAFAGYPWHFVYSFGNKFVSILSTFLSRLNQKRNFHFQNFSQYSLVSGLSSIQTMFYSPYFLQALENSYATRLPVLADPSWKKASFLERTLRLDYELLLAGHLLVDKGDRMSMSASIEARYPFLDKELVQFSSQLENGWKIKNFKNKWILRSLAEKYLPKETAWRKKHLFRAEPVIHGKSHPHWVKELLSPESLEITNLFDPLKVHNLFQKRLNSSPFSFENPFLQVGLSGIISTQLLYHLFSKESLCSLPKLQEQFV